VQADLRGILAVSFLVGSHRDSELSKELLDGFFSSLFLFKLAEIERGQTLITPSVNDQRLLVSKFIPGIVPKLHTFSQDERRSHRPDIGK
jgi:hypothetical protein